MVQAGEAVGTEAEHERNVGSNGISIHHWFKWLLTVRLVEKQCGNGRNALPTVEVSCRDLEPGGGPLKVRW